MDDFDDESDEYLDVDTRSLGMFSSAPAAEEKKESLAPDKLQHSIANEDPQALINAAQNNAVVQEMLDLFQGEVIDIHR